MSRVDEELAQAVRESEETAQAEPAAEPLPPRPPVRRSVGLLVALLVMAAGILTLVFTSFEGAAVYTRELDQVAADRDKLLDRNLRVEGMLKRGSLVRRDSPCEYRFTIKKGNIELPMRYSQCVVPDNFRDAPGMDVKVIAEGKLDPAGHFQATTIIPQCPSKYEMEQRAQKGETAPHDAFKSPPPSPRL